MSAFSVENPHDGKTFENYTRFEWGVEVGVVTTFMLRLFVPHEFDMGTDSANPRAHSDPVLARWRIARNVFLKERGSLRFDGLFI